MNEDGVLELDERAILMDRPGAAMAAMNMMRVAFMVASEIRLWILSCGDA